MTKRWLVMLLVVLVALPALAAPRKVKTPPPPTIAPEKVDAIFGVFERGTRSGDQTFTVILQRQWQRPWPHQRQIQWQWECEFCRSGALQGVVRCRTWAQLLQP